MHTRIYLLNKRPLFTFNQKDGFPCQKLVFSDARYVPLGLRVLIIKFDNRCRLEHIPRKRNKSVLIHRAINLCICVCVCACVRACVRACARACVVACVREGLTIVVVVSCLLLLWHITHLRSKAYLYRSDGATMVQLMVSFLLLTTPPSTVMWPPKGNSYRPPFRPGANSPTNLQRRGRVAANVAIYYLDRLIDMCEPYDTCSHNTPGSSSNTTTG